MVQNNQNIVAIQRDMKIVKQYNYQSLYTISFHHVDLPLDKPQKICKDVTSMMAV